MIEPSRSGDDTSLLLRGESKVEIQEQRDIRVEEEDARRWTQEAPKARTIHRSRKHQNWGRRWRASLRILQDGQGEAQGAPPALGSSPGPCGRPAWWQRWVYRGDVSFPGSWKCHWLWNWQRWANLVPLLPVRSQGKNKECERGREYCETLCVLVMTLNF